MGEAGRGSPVRVLDPRHWSNVSTTSEHRERLGLVEYGAPERLEGRKCELMEDMLTLTGSCRGLVVPDSMFVEISLKIKGDGTADDKDLGKGVIEPHRVPFDKRPMTELLTSWQSRVELVLAHVPCPVEATVKVNILNGPRDAPFHGKVTTWTAGDAHNHIILYEYDNKGWTIVNLVVVPILDPLSDEYEEIALNICFVASNDEDELTAVTLRYPEEEKAARILDKPDFSPTTWLRRLVTLCDKASSTPIEVVRDIVERQFRKSFGEICDFFEVESVGSASIARLVTSLDC
ncbi:hypothetical protein ACQ4PT_016413 [Festuca glaucescens]